MPIKRFTLESLLHDITLVFQSEKEISGGDLLSDDDGRFYRVNPKDPSNIASIPLEPGMDEILDFDDAINVQEIFHSSGAKKV